MAGSGITGKRRRQALQGDLDWQRGGYHMEELPSENAEMADSERDPGYTLPPTEMDDRLRTGIGGMQSAERRMDDFENHLQDFISEEQKQERAQTEQQSPPREQVQTPERDGEKKGHSERKPLRRKNGEQTLRWDRSRLKTALIAAAAVVVIAAVLLFAAGELTRIRVIRVDGNLRVPDEEVIRLSGLKTNTSVLMLDQEEIGAGIARNPYLQLIAARRPSLNVVELAVREREQAAYTLFNGYLYVLDYRGMVLEEYGDTDVRPALLRVASMDVKRCVRGERIAVYNERQLTAFTEIMIEIQIQGLMSVVSEMYVGDLNNISLATYDGYSVHIGANSEIHEKLTSMELVRQYLITEGIHGGTIDVSDCVNPTHIPETLPETGTVTQS